MPDQFSAENANSKENSFPTEKEEPQNPLEAVNEVIEKMSGINEKRLERYNEKKTTSQ